MFGIIPRKCWEEAPWAWDPSPGKGVLIFCRDWENCCHCHRSAAGDGHRERTGGQGVSGSKLEGSMSLLPLPRPHFSSPLRSPSLSPSPSLPSLSFAFPPPSLSVSLIPSICFSLSAFLSLSLSVPISLSHLLSTCTDSNTGPAGKAEPRGSQHPSPSIQRRVEKGRVGAERR